MSQNDTGENGSHQAGILIPKNPSELLKFFPEVDINKKNPRISLPFMDEYDNEWVFNFIYYNNCFFGGTRNEYRLTGMTEFIRSNDLKVGDEVFFRKNDESKYFISFRKKDHSQKIEISTKKILKLSKKWRVISF